VEEDFVRNLFAGGETQLGRTFVNEKALAADSTLTVMDYERPAKSSKPPCTWALAPAIAVTRCSTWENPATPHGHLHDLQRHRAVAHQARHRAPG